MSLDKLGRGALIPALPACDELQVPLFIIAARPRSASVIRSKG